MQDIFFTTNGFGTFLTKAPKIANELNNIAKKEDGINNAKGNCNFLVCFLKALRRILKHAMKPL